MASSNNLEFYEKAAKLRKELRRRKNSHVRILPQIVYEYFKNQDNFPSYMAFDIYYLRISTVREILEKLDFPIEEYQFKKERYHRPGGFYSYRLTILKKR